MSIKFVLYNSHRLENIIRFDSQLILIEQKIKELRIKKENIILIGDFNGDIYRKKYNNDIKLLNWISKLKLNNIRPEKKNPIHTYESGNNMSYLDYVLSDPRINKTKIQLNIDRHWMNTSDHLALLVILNIDKTPQSEITETEHESCIKRERNINWQNIELRNEYENKVISNIKKIKINTIWKEGEDPEERIEQCYNNLSSCFINTHNEIIKER